MNKYEVFFILFIFVAMVNNNSNNNNDNNNTTNNNIFNYFSTLIKLINFKNNYELKKFN